MRNRKKKDENKCRPVLKLRIYIIEDFYCFTGFASNVFFFRGKSCRSNLVTNCLTILNNISLGRDDKGVLCMSCCDEMAERFGHKVV